MDGYSALKKAEVLVAGLLDYKKNFIEMEGEDKLISKNSMIQKRLKDVLADLDNLQLLIENKAAFFCLRGKALNVLPTFDPRSVESLSKAVKLDPGLIEAWNELGESYWKDKKIEEAHNCFLGAISKCKNKVSLRNLSMVQRQLGKDYSSRANSIKESVSTAKSAVSMDLNDGHSWFVLGNAYLSLFFYAGQCPAALKQCMAAYTKAENDKHELNNSDLYYNRAVAYKYQEFYGEALRDYEKSSKLDPSWDDPRDNAEDLLKRLKTIAEMIKYKGKHKQKKINNFLSQIKDVDLGVYSSGVYTSPLNKTISLKKVMLEDLKLQRNDGLAVVGKVVSVIPVKDGVPFCFVLMDQDSTCVAVSVFNMAVGKGVITSDSVAIPEPYVQDHSIARQNENFSFRNIRVDNPVVMVINKRKVGPDRLAFSVLSVTNDG